MLEFCLIPNLWWYILLEISLVLNGNRILLRVECCWKSKKEWPWRASVACLWMKLLIWISTEFLWFFHMIRYWIMLLNLRMNGNHMLLWMNLLCLLYLGLDEVSCPFLWLWVKRWCQLITYIMTDCWYCLTAMYSLECLFK